VRTAAKAEVLRFSLVELNAFFEKHPRIGASFLRSVANSAEALLEEAREELVTRLRPDTLLAHWKQNNASKKITGLDFETSKPLSSDLSPRISTEESWVTNAAPRAYDVLLRSAFFDGLPDEMLHGISSIARIEYFCRGEVIKRSRTGSSDLLVLADGRVRPEYTGTCGHTVALRTATSSGDVIGGGSPSPNGAAVRLRATRDGSLLRLSRSSLSRLFLEQAPWAYLFQRRILALLSERLRSTRAHLVSESFEQEVLAVDNVLEQVRTELSVSSKLHQLPHLIRASVTVPLALGIIDHAKGSTDPLEARLAQLCHELVTPLRREARFFAGLQAAYEQVVQAPKEQSAASVRKVNAESFLRVFSEIPHRIEGEELLPERPGHIFVFNHLRNHEDNTLPNGFQLTLDSHFISAMILHRKYGDPGVRVVRRSRANEYGHHSYYSRLGHISVYTRDSDVSTTSSSERLAEFLRTSESHLTKGQNLVIAPEGTSLATEESPGPLKSGAFRLAAQIEPQPLIVPIAVANFDRRLGRTTLCARILPPFHMRERVKHPHDASEMDSFLSGLRAELRSVVGQLSNGKGG